MVIPTQLQRNVLAELDWDPSVNAAKVGVTVDDGVVTVTGTVDKMAGSPSMVRWSGSFPGMTPLASSVGSRV